MKSTELLNDAGKSVDLASAASVAILPSDSSSPENKRRRLVRGAVAFAPLVLTLRSGGLAAASCTGAIRRAKVTDSNGRLGDVNGNALFAKDAQGNPINTDLTAGSNKCVVIEEADVCSASPLRIVTKPVRQYNPTVFLTTNNNDRQRFKCTGAGFDVGKPVAILSSTSATSLV